MPAKHTTSLDDIIEKRKGLSINTFLGPHLGTHMIAVAAAAVVPSSFTSTTALWMIRLTDKVSPFCKNSSGVCSTISLRIIPYSSPPTPSNRPIEDHAIVAQDAIWDTSLPSVFSRKGE